MRGTAARLEPSTQFIAAWKMRNRLDVDLYSWGLQMYDRAPRSNSSAGSQISATPNVQKVPDKRRSRASKPDKLCNVPAADAISAAMPTE